MKERKHVVCLFSKRALHDQQTRENNAIVVNISLLHCEQIIES